MTPDRLIAWLREGVDLLEDYFALKDASQSLPEPRADDFGTPPPSLVDPATRRAVEALQDKLIASQLAPTPKRRGRPRKYEPRVPIQPVVTTAHEIMRCTACLNDRPDKMIPVDANGCCRTCGRAVEWGKPTNEDQTYTCTHCKRLLPIRIRDLHESNCAAAEKGYTTHESRKPDGSSTL